MISKKGLVIGLAAALALGASGVASAITVDGITWNPGSPFDLNINSLNLRESAVTGIGQTLMGYGQVGSINGDTNFCSGCNLTFQFTYTVQYLQGTGSGTTQAIFNMGSVQFYVSNPGTFNVGNPASAGLGTPWLTLTGHDGYVVGFPTAPVGQLFSTINGTPSAPTSGSAGIGFLDATGGPAAMYMHTQTQADGLGGFADFTINSSFLTQIARGCGSTPSSDPTSICHYPIQGTAELIGKTVPEPGALGMLGLGMGMLGVFFWRRRKEADDQV